MRLKNWSFILFLLWVFISVFAQCLANEKKLIVKDKNGLSFPFLTQYKADTNSITFQLNAPIPYSPQTIDYNATGAIAPVQLNASATLKTHWLGTDFIGRDVLANLIYGSQSAFIIGLFSMLLAALIGISLGGFAAIHAANRQRINIWAALILMLIGSIYFIQVYIIPWSIVVIPFVQKVFVFLLITGIALTVTFFVLKFFNSKKKQLIVPIDHFINRVIEILESLPLLFLLVTLNSIIQPSYFTIIIIIALVAWPTFARFSRAEFLKVINLDYVEGAEALGYTKTRMLFKHILPNTLTPLLVTFTFGVVGAILVESTLTFMGLGLANEGASWGEMINMARKDYSAWWLAVFPGITLFFVLIVLNQLGNKIKKRS